MRPAVSAASPAQVVRRSKRANSFAIERCYSFALIVIDRAAFSYQSSDFKTFGRLTDLRSSPFVFLDRELGDLRSNFGDASTFTTAKYLLPPRTKYPPDQRRFISRTLGVSKQLAVEASIAPSRPLETPVAGMVRTYDDPMPAGFHFAAKRPYARCAPACPTLLPAPQAPFPC